MNGLQFTRPQFTEFSCLGRLITSYDQSQKQRLSLKMQCSWFGPDYPRKQSTVPWKTSASDCRHVC